MDILKRLSIESQYWFSLAASATYSFSTSNFYLPVTSPLGDPKF
jgi:hypothetical protein